jgi:hypothetical protein
MIPSSAKTNSTQSIHPSTRLRTKAKACSWTEGSGSAVYTESMTTFFVWPMRTFFWQPINQKRYGLKLKIITTDKTSYCRHCQLHKNCFLTHLIRKKYHVPQGPHSIQPQRGIHRLCQLDKLFNASALYDCWLIWCEVHHYVANSTKCCNLEDNIEIAMLTNFNKLRTNEVND